MGTLRLEPKKEVMSLDKYNDLAGILREARLAAKHSRIYWDLEDEENASQVRRDFLYVAQEEKIGLAIRRPRGTSSLELRFEEAPKQAESEGPKRIPAEESRQRILAVLKDADGALRKADIVSNAEISPSTWNARIKELLADGRVIRHGRQRDATYTMP